MPVRERKYAGMGPREIVVEGTPIPLKPEKDNRLLRNLTLDEFITAFNIYSNVITEQYPNRRNELARYLNRIMYISRTFGGFTFYQYHTEFSALAAQYFEKGILLDWGEGDRELFQKITAGKKANQCNLCFSFDHLSPMCHLAATKAPEVSLTQSYSLNKRKHVCQYHNTEKGCIKKQNCSYRHACSTCLSPKHVAYQCNRTAAVNRTPTTVTTA